MKYVGIIFLLIIALTAGAFWYFSRWWQGRVVLRATPLPIPSVTPGVEGLKRVMTKYGELAAGEKEKQLESKVEGYVGVVRYSGEGSRTNFTLFVEGGDGQKLEVEMGSGTGVVSLGQMREEKVGVILSGEVEKAKLPVIVSVKRGEVAVLTGVIEAN